MATETTTHPNITRTPGMRGGQPCIRGTGIPVWLVAGYATQGFSVAEIAEMYPHITELQVQDALAYYAAHRPEVDAVIEEQNAYPVEPWSSEG